MSSGSYLPPLGSVHSRVARLSSVARSERYPSRNPPRVSSRALSRSHPRVARVRVSSRSPVVLSGGVIGLRRYELPRAVVGRLSYLGLLSGSVSLVSVLRRSPVGALGLAVPPACVLSLAARLFS